ncbi:MAG: tagaturonate reductase [Clostridiales bacterium]|nr:tagaturonate reductase [Clostridiales bacterium]
MKGIQECFEREVRPIRVLQFGEGNFLRAFADWMIDILNEKKLFDGAVAIVKPIPMGDLNRFKKQDHFYTVCLRGNVDGKKTVENRVVTSVQESVDCYADYAAYAAYAKLPTLRFVISNTTEAGIVYDPKDQFSFEPPHSYPGKLTKLLFERAEHFDYAKDKGLVILPVELIDDNGIALKKCVKQLSKDWNLGEKFDQWLEEACVFTSTLVDRIVTGYPREEAAQLCEQFGYQDDLIVTAEPFGLWVIESEKDISKELPLDKAGLPVIFTDNQKPYKQRKVRILNGAHTSFVLAAYLCGHDIVGQAMNDPLFLSFIRNTLHQEVIPTLDLDQNDLESFATAVEHRFNNPFVKHLLLSISLNSVSKWRARCMPSLEEYYARKGEMPLRLAFSLAALISFYQGNRMEDGALMGERNGEAYRILDDADVLSFFLENSQKSAEELTHLFLSNEGFFGKDLTCYNGLEAYVTEALSDIRANGMRVAMEKRFQ